MLESLYQFLCQISWYYLVFVLSAVLFLFKGIASLVFGEFDVDGDLDSDLAGLLSLKGLIHFFLGFSATLSTISFLKTESLYTVYSFSSANYATAIFVGMVFMVVLFYLWKSVMRYFNEESPKEMDYTGMKGEVALDNENGTFTVNVSTPSGVRQVDVKDSHKEVPHAVGDYVTLKYDEETKTYMI